MKPKSATESVKDVNGNGEHTQKPTISVFTLNPEEQREKFTVNMTPDSEYSVVSGHSKLKQFFSGICCKFIGVK